MDIIEIKSAKNNGDISHRVRSIGAADKSSREDGVLRRTDVRLVIRDPIAEAF